MYVCLFLAYSREQDSVFEFEKKRNVPVKYDRELWAQTGRGAIPFDNISVRAMKRVNEIKLKREAQFIKNR